MNIEFHYYTVYFLAQRSGFSPDDSHLIAYSSQFVDSNIIHYVIDIDGTSYKTQVTQNYGFWNNEALRTINIPFHFIPGGDKALAFSSRKDGKSCPLITVPNSDNAKSLLISALRTGDLYRIGIAVHSFADTWAHQNFIGLHSPLNSLTETGVIPPIGHAQALQKPDQMHLVWEDPRLLNSKVDNYDRFMAAAKKIYRYFCAFHKKDFNDEELVLDELRILYKGRGRPKKLEERILDFIIEEGIEKYSRIHWLEENIGELEDPGDETLFKGYNKVLWLKDEVLYGNSLLKRKAKKASSSFYNSHLHKWMEAAKEHQQKALELFGNLLKKDS